MTHAPKLRLEPDSGPIAPDAALAEINGLPRLAQLLRDLTAGGGAIPADSKYIEAALRARDLDAIAVRPEQIDALVALGAVARVMVGTTLHLVWEADAGERGGTVPATPSVLNEEDLRFRLDIETDIEHERLLLYRVLLVLELLAGVLVARHFLLGYLQG